jgi:hypothetical protein
MVTARENPRLAALSMVISQAGSAAKVPAVIVKV